MISFDAEPTKSTPLDAMSTEAKPGVEGGATQPTPESIPKIPRDRRPPKVQTVVSVGKSELA